MDILLEKFADQCDKLFSMGIIRTDSFTGEIGEYVAKEHFKLTLTDRVERAIDGIDPYGYKYQVKSTCHHQLTCQNYPSIMPDAL